MPIKVLYIEDARDQADVVADILQYQFEDIQVQTASNGIDGINKARTWDPDLILLDLMMPRADGIEVIHRIRRDPKIGEVPIVVISVWAGPGSQAANIAEQAGANAVFPKPLEAEQLANIVSHYARPRSE